MHQSRSIRIPFSRSIFTICVRMLLALTVLGLTAPASAATMYTFTFGGSAAGHFITDGVGVDPGYELVTSMTFDFVTTRDDGMRHDGPFTTTRFQPGAAYNPSTERFINHFAGGTYEDIGGFFLRGPNNEVLSLSGSFPHGLDGYLDNDHLRSTGSPFVGAGVPLDPPAAIPEPASLVLLGTGLLGSTMAHRRLRRRTA